MRGDGQVRVDQQEERGMVQEAAEKIQENGEVDLTHAQCSSSILLLPPHPPSPPPQVLYTPPALDSLCSALTPPPPSLPPQAPLNSPPPRLHASHLSPSCLEPYLSSVVTYCCATSSVTAD